MILSSNINELILSISNNMDFLMPHNIFFDCLGYTFKKNSIDRSLTSLHRLK